MARSTLRAHRLHRNLSNALRTQHNYDHISTNHMNSRLCDILEPCLLICMCRFRRFANQFYKSMFTKANQRPYQIFLY
jgi:hypothetical protein